MKIRKKRKRKRKLKEIQNNHIKISFQTDLIYYHLLSLRPLIKTYYSAYSSIEFDDAFNELYIQIHISIHNLKCINSFNNWGLKIFISHLKPIEFEKPLNNYISIEDFSTNVLHRRYIENFLNSLKNIEKQILVDSIIHDIPLLELAEKHNLSYANIRIIKHRALKKFKNSNDITSFY